MADAAIVIPTQRDWMFSSEFAKLVISAPSSAPFELTVELKTLTGKAQELLSNTYVPDDMELVTLWGIDELLARGLEGYESAWWPWLELCLKADGNAFAHVNVRMSRVPVEGWTSAEEFLDLRFLSCCDGVRETVPGRLETLNIGSVINRQSYSITCRYFDGHGLVERVTEGMHEDLGVPLDVSPSQFLDPGAGTLVEYDVKAGKRLQRYTVCGSLPRRGVVMEFVNNFGAKEAVTLTGLHETSVKTTRTTARAGGLTVLADLDEEATHTVHTGPLTPGMVPVIADLLRSRSVRLLPGGQEIIITDSKAGWDSSGRNMPDFTISYRLASRSQLPVPCSGPVRTFSPEYDETYQ